MSDRLITRINGNNGKCDDSAKTLLIIIVIAVAVAIIWYFYKFSNMMSSGSLPSQQTTRARPLRAVVSPVRPSVGVPVPRTQATPAPSDEKVKVVKVKADSIEPYEQTQLANDTIENPDFLMQIGRDPMTEVRNKIKTIDDLQYSTPQDLLGVDAVLQADAQVQAEDVTLHTGTSTMFGTGINTSSVIRGRQNPYIGDVAVAPAINQQVVALGATQSDRLNPGYIGSAYDPESA